MNVILFCPSCPHHWFKTVSCDPTGIPLQDLGHCPECGTDMAYELLLQEQQRYELLLQEQQRRRDPEPE